jgi:hypothetical protein
MLLAMLVMGCEDATPSWDLLEPFGTADPISAGALTPSPPPRLAGQLVEAEQGLEDALADADERQDDDGFDDPWGPNSDSDDDEAQAAPADEPEPETGTPVMPQVAGGAGLAIPFGLPDSAAWGVRLLGTIPNAQPPRAALGLPDGTEVIVTPGSMLPTVGMVVITVGADAVQVARVTPAGDHAEVEMINLVAQYARTAPGR